MDKLWESPVISCGRPVAEKSLHKPSTVNTGDNVDYREIFFRMISTLFRVSSELLISASIFLTPEMTVV